jgi:phosphate starvation-inducible PhoH-like protein
MSNRKRDTKKQQNPTKFSNDKILNRYTPKTKNQAEYIKGVIENEITVCVGPAGCGKTCCVLSLMLEHLLEGKIDKIVLCRPLVQSGGGVGFLPGVLENKAEPFLTPFNCYINEIIGVEQHKKLLAEGRIEIVYLEFLRGMTFNNAYLLLDEAENCDKKSLVMFLTRIGLNSKVILNGDYSQSDLRGQNKSGLEEIFNKLIPVQGCFTIKLGKEDILRSGIIGRVLTALE